MLLSAYAAGRQDAGPAGRVVAVEAGFVRRDMRDRGDLRRRDGADLGTGYQTAHDAIAGDDVFLRFGAAKFLATLATASGLPGGIFAPSLSAGAGIGDVLRNILPAYPPGAVVLLGMVAFFTGVVRAPLMAVIIISETTASRGLMMPLLGAALMGDLAAQFVSKEKLYNKLAQRFAAIK